jgi:DNA-binding transcriptional ArsR family regulator
MVMSVLAKILSSRVKAEIFRLLFGLSAKELHLRELERQSGLAVGTVRQELQRLVQLELVVARRDSNRVYYRANQEHPLYPEIRNLVLKTAGLVDVLHEALGEEEILVAFVFGSVARAEEGAQSDVDLMVIGPIGLRQLSRRLSSVSTELGRAVNPHVVSAEEFRRRKAKRDHFLIRVLESPQIFVVGGKDDLEAMG